MGVKRIPTREDVAEAVGAALDSALLEVTVTQDGQPSDLDTLARVLDKNGLIDWATVMKK